jgi:hypothetical protein
MLLFVIDLGETLTYMNMNMPACTLCPGANPTGQAGGACTSTLLNFLYADEKVPEDDLR